MSELEVDAQSRGRQLIQQAADAFWAEKYPNNAVTHEYRLGFYVAHQLMEEEGITLDRLNAVIEASFMAEAGRLRYEAALKEIALVAALDSGTFGRPILRLINAALTP